MADRVREGGPIMRRYPGWEAASRVPADPRSLVTPALVCAATLIAVGFVVAARTHDQTFESDPVGSANDILVGLLTIAAGAVGWWRLPRNATGALLVATGFAWWFGDLSRLGGATWWTIGQFAAVVYVALGVHALVAFPSGRVAGRVALATVIAAYATKTLGQAGWLAFRGPHLTGCVGCAQNLALIRDSPSAFHVTDVALNGAQIVIAVVVAVLLVTRWRSATPATRTALAPVLLAGGIVVAVGLVDVLTWVVAPAAGSVLSRVFSLVLWLVPAAFLVGLLRARLARGAVSQLIVELGRDPSPTQLAVAIAAALGDPTCWIAYWIPEIDGYADASGSPVTLPVGDPTRSVTELRHDSHRIAALVCDASLIDDNPRLVEGVAAAAQLAIENSRLQAELRVQLIRVRESRVRIIEATDRERQRLERDLHDGTQQFALKALIELDHARRQLDDPPAAATTLAGVRSDLEELLSALRAVARGLNPAILTDQGLPGALDWLAGRCAVPVTVRRAPATRLPAGVEAAAYYVCAEALTNAQKHAAATQITIDAEQVGGVLRVAVADDGRGGARPATSGGLRGLADRVEALDGTLRIDSPAGHGTLVEAVIPCG
jgi:signal transduction histidine kinase